MSPTSPCRAACPGLCRGEDAADSPGRQFPFSPQFDITRLRLCRDSSNGIPSKQPREDRDPVRPSLKAGTGGSGRAMRHLICVREQHLYSGRTRPVARCEEKSETAVSVAIQTKRCARDTTPFVHMPLFVFTAARV